MLSPRALAVLQMASYLDEEIVAEGIACFVGEERTTWGVVRQLLHCLALSDVSDTKGIKRFVVSSSGEAILRRPDLATEIAAAVLGGINFTIRDDRVVPI